VSRTSEALDDIADWLERSSGQAALVAQRVPIAIIQGMLLDVV
jgi:hypothetical protein